MTGPASLRSHLVRAVPFPPLRPPQPVTIACSCGWSASVMPDLSGRAREAGSWTRYVPMASPDPWQPVADAWLAHRLSAKAGPASLTRNSDGAPSAFRRDNGGKRAHHTAVGNTALSPAERGRMGQAAKGGESRCEGEGCGVSAPIWENLGGLLRSRVWRLELFWNVAGQCFTARVLDGVGRFAPPEGEGEILAAGAGTPVEALQQVAVQAWKRGLRP